MMWTGFCKYVLHNLFLLIFITSTVKLGDKEQIGVKGPFSVTNLPIYFIRIKGTFGVQEQFGWPTILG